MRAMYSNRRLTALLAALLLTAPLGLLPGQQEAGEPENTVKVLRVLEGDAEHIAVLLRSFNVQVQTSNRLGLITVAGRPDDVARAEKALREIEQLTMRTPNSITRDVELTVHFLGIVDQDSPPPDVLRDVVAELKKTFPFRGYKLLETLAVRVRAGEESSVSGFLPETLTEEGPPTSYNFGSRVAAIEPRQNSQLVRFQYIRSSIRLAIPQGGNFVYQEIGINTALEVLDGKTVVVGKAGSVGQSQGYLLVLTAKVVQ